MNNVNICIASPTSRIALRRAPRLLRPPGGHLHHVGGPPGSVAVDGLLRKEEGEQQEERGRGGGGGRVDAHLRGDPHLQGHGPHGRALLQRAEVSET